MVYQLANQELRGLESSSGRQSVASEGGFVRFVSDFDQQREARRSNQENRTKPKRNPNQKGENERVGVDQHKTQTQKYNERGLKSGPKNLMRDGGDKSDIQSKTKAKTTKTKLAAI